MSPSLPRPLKSTLPSVRRILPLFLAIVVCLAFWKVWLTWRLMEQDRSLAARRSRERLEQIADLGMAQLYEVGYVIHATSGLNGIESSMLKQ